MTWQTGVLTDLGTVERGRSRHRPRNDPSLFGGPYPFFQTGDIKAANLWLRDCSDTYNENGLAQSRLWPTGTLCITIAANIAETAILAAPGCFPDSVVGFTPHLDRADVLFVKYLLDYVRYRFQAISRGTTQDNLSVDKLLSVRFDYPPVRTQRKIAGILSAYDDLIENNNRRMKLLEEMTQRIYREWFVDFRYPGHRRAPLLESEFGLIPQDWKWRALGALAEDVRIGADPRAVDPDTPYIGLEHLPEHSIAIQDWGVATDAASSKLAFEVGDVLFGKIRPYFHKVGPPPIAGICSTDAIVIRARANEFAGLVLAVISSDLFVQEAVQTSQGTKMPRANWKVLEKFPVPVPTEELLRKFNDLMESTVGTIHRLVMATRNLRATRDLLLPRLISGEIDADDLDIQLPEAA